MVIEIEDFIRIIVLELEKENYVYFVEDYNKKYFYITNDNELYTHKSIDICYNCYDLYFKKARIIHRDNLDKLKKYVYELHRKLTVKIGRAEKGKYYYFINTYFKVIEIPDEYEHFDNSQYNSFNYFLTEEEATKYAKILQENLIKLLKGE